MESIYFIWEGIKQPILLTDFLCLMKDIWKKWALTGIENLSGGFKSSHSCLYFSQAINLASETLLGSLASVFIFLCLVCSSLSKGFLVLSSCPLDVATSILALGAGRLLMRAQCWIYTRWTHKRYNTSSYLRWKLINWTEKGFFSCSNWVLLEINASSSCNILYNAGVLWRYVRNFLALYFSKDLLKLTSVTTLYAMILWMTTKGLQRTTLKILGVIHLWYKFYYLK